MHPEKRTIAVDLDGTLAHYDQWCGTDKIGPPIPAMLQRVMQWLADGHEVVIFTARITPLPGEPETKTAVAIGYVKQWLDKYGLPALEVTNVKRQNFFQFWDDRCIQIEPNTGKLIADLAYADGCRETYVALTREDKKS